MPTPLANLVAVSSPDRQELELAARIAAADPELDAACEPRPGWIAISRRFGGGNADPDEVRGAGLVFAEGRSAIERSGIDWPGVAGIIGEDPEQISKLPGDFGLIAFTGDGSARVVRSAGGLVPFYVAGEAGRWTIATTLELLIRFHPQALAPDPLINAIWCSGYDAAPQRRTFLRGVQAIGRGEYATLDSRGRRFARWWHPERIRPEARDEHAAELRDSLIRTLEREADPAGGNLLALSGGVDSSAIGALAAGTLGIPLGSLTVLPEDARSRQRDLGYIQSLTQAVPLAPAHFEAVDPARRLDLLAAPAVPFHVLQPYLCLLRSAAEKQPVTTLLGGEFADHTVGSTLTLRDWSRHTSALELWRMRSKLPTGRSDVRNWLTWKLAPSVRRPPVPWPDSLPDAIRPNLRDEYGQWFRERRARAVRDSRQLALPYLQMFTERDGFLAMHWETTSALGIRRCFPFVTREVLELSFSCEPRELVAPGTKRLLRAALSDDVPAHNLDRPDKGVPASGSWPKASWEGPTGALVEDVLEPGWDNASELDYWSVFRAKQLIAFENSLQRVQFKAQRTRENL